MEGGWNALAVSAKNGDQASKGVLERYRKEGQERFIVALHFDGINHVAYANFKSDVHNGWLIQGVETMPTRIDQKICLCN